MKDRQVTVWSSPYLRCLQTAMHYSNDIRVSELLGEYQLSGYYNENCKIEDLLVHS